MAKRRSLRVAAASKSAKESLAIQQSRKRNSNDRRSLRLKRKEEEVRKKYDFFSDSSESEEESSEESSEYSSEEEECFTRVTRRSFVAEKEVKKGGRESGDKKKRNSDKENDKWKEEEEEEEEEAKSEFLGAAFGLRKSTSPKEKKGESKIVKKSSIPVPANEKEEEKADDKADKSKSEAEPEGGISNELEAEPEAPKKVKKVRSVTDAVPYYLAATYEKNLDEVEEYSLNYICQEVNHPVISCFRELSRSDITHIVGSSKFKKSCNNLEQSVVYLGLIDLLATTNNSAFHGENFNQKFSKKVAKSVQRVLFEFKSIIGSWALSGNEKLSGRYTLIINYLRNLIPFFKASGFDIEFSEILDSIEKEVARLRSNHEKIKAMSSISSAPEKKVPSASASSAPTDQPQPEGEEPRPALGEIVLNVSLTVKDDSEDEDEVAVVEEKTPKIFGKPLNASKKKVRKTPTAKKGLFSFQKSNATKDDVKKKSGEAKQPTLHSSSTPSSLPEPKKLTTVSDKKRSADEALRDDKEGSKKPKLDKPANGKTLLNFFSKSSDAEASTPTSDKPKPKPVNAFALMMNRSRELAQQKKSTATPKVSAVAKG